jgi:hypothetical protein
VTSRMGTGKSITFLLQFVDLLLVNENASMAEVREQGLGHFLKIFLHEMNTQVGT